MEFRKRVFFLLAVVAAGLAVSLLAPSIKTRAQDTPITAAVISGSCARPGENFGDLRDLSAAEGGVLVSFGRVDIPLAELQQDGYAIAISQDGKMLACGDIGGGGSDIYIALPSVSAEGYGGIAWLRDRDTETQVSLFITNDLGEGSSGDDDQPEPPAEETPRPTETATASEETPTPETEGEVTRYVSPTWGYSIDYDASWKVVVNETFPTQYGPQDSLALERPDSTVILYSNTAEVGFDVRLCADFELQRLQEQEGVTNAAILVDSDGEEVRGGNATDAYVAFSFTYELENGQTVDLVDYFSFKSIPGKEAIAILLYESTETEFNMLAPVRNALQDTFKVPEE